MTGNFDPTLKKYRSTVVSVTCHLKPVAESFQDFIDYRRSVGTSEQAIYSRYLPLLSHLQRFGNITSEQSARAFVDLLRSRQSALIANQNLSLLKGFASWAVTSGLMPSNYFTDIHPLKVHSLSRRKPFTVDEIRLLLDAVKNEPILSHYHDFCVVLLFLGLRPSEAIGLRWQLFM